MRVLLTGGGTGGHVYPALAVASALRRAQLQADWMAEASHSPDSSPVDLLYVGSRDGLEIGIVARSGLPYAGVATSALRGRSSIGVASGVLKLVMGLGQALAILREHCPDVVLATGGYVCVPLVLAARLLRIPVLLYLPDVEPGLAVRFLARFANRIVVSCDASTRFLPPRKVVVTGYPVRPELLRAERKQARTEFGLPADDTVLLVFGGSRGAQAINEALADALPILLQRVHVIHVAGESHEEWLRARATELPPQLARRYHLYAYLHADMGAALAAADLVVSRSGASVLGELPAFGLPGILVPYPHAGAHQRLNAEYLAEGGAAVVLDDTSVRDGGLLAAVDALLDDPDRLRVMAEAARRLSRPGASTAIAREIWRLAKKHTGEVKSTE